MVASIWASKSAWSSTAPCRVTCMGLQTVGLCLHTAVPSAEKYSRQNLFQHSILEMCLFCPSCIALVSGLSSPTASRSVVSVSYTQSCVSTPMGWTYLVLHHSDSLALNFIGYFFFFLVAFYYLVLLDCTLRSRGRKGLYSLGLFTACGGVLSWEAGGSASLAWLRSPVGSANRKVWMFKFSSQLPASSFVALTICCNGKAVFKQNIHMWVLDDTEMSQGMNE